MNGHEAENALVVIDYSNCGEDFLYGRAIPEVPYGDRVWREIQTIEGEFRDDGIIPKDSPPLFELKRADVVPFADHTFKVTMPDVEEGERRIYNNVRGRKCVIISAPHVTDAKYVFANGLTAEALTRADAKRDIVLWEMYNGHYRQDRRQGRESLGAPVVAAVYNANNINHIFTYDAHFAQLEGFFPKFDNLPLLGWLTVYYRDRYGTEDLVVVSPDVGSVSRARRAAKFLGVPMAYMDKDRDPVTGEVKIVGFQGDVKGRRCLIVDDLISSAKTLVLSREYLDDRGAAEVSAMNSHLQLTPGAKERVKEQEIKVIAGDTFDHVFTPEDLKTFDVVDTSRMTAMITLMKVLRKDIGRYFDWQNPDNWERMQLRPLFPVD